MEDRLKHLEKLIETLTEKVDKVVTFMEQTTVHQDYYEDRFNRQCDRINDHEDRIKALEDENNVHRGEIGTVKWMVTTAGVVATVATVVVMLFK